jgi:uncharacterized 2Fe-2S/4Fe-4S cluster protein (DUF4445 family)
VDAVASGLALGWIMPSGRLTRGDAVTLTPPVQITQTDVRELQLAKAAVAAGLRLLVKQWGATLDDVTRIYLAGAFGNCINRAGARRIGLLNLPTEKIQPAGNTALLGAKLSLFSAGDHGASHPDIVNQVAHVPLDEDPSFQEMFIEEMTFPNG